MKNRSRHDIASVILESAAIGSGVTKTKVMYSAFLSYAQLKEYLAILQEKGLIEYQEVEGTYITTEKGLNFLQISNKMNELTSNIRMKEI
jgi:predicted transcriptional regulator